MAPVRGVAFSCVNCAAHQVATLLLDSGAVADVRDNVTGKTALIKTAYVGHAPVAELLLTAGADKNATDNQGYSALAFAASFNHEAVLTSLLKVKVEGNEKSIRGE